MKHPPEAYRQCAAAGLTRAETATQLGVTRSAVSAAAQRHGITFTIPPYVNGSCQPTKVRGVVYPSQSDAARALGVKPASIHQHLMRGTIDRAGLRDGQRVRG